MSGTPLIKTTPNENAFMPFATQNAMLVCTAEEI